jgi:hypothetical protein
MKPEIPAVNEAAEGLCKTPFQEVRQRGKKAPVCGIFQIPENEMGCMAHDCPASGLPEVNYPAFRPVFAAAGIESVTPGPQYRRQQVQ